VSEHLSDAEYAEHLKSIAADENPLAHADDVETAAPEVPAEPETPDVPEWEPLPSMSLEERVQNVEAFLGPRVADIQRAEELDRMQRHAEAFQDASPHEAADYVAQATRQAVEQRLGIQQAQGPSLPEIQAAADEMAGHHFGDEWPELRERVVEEMLREPRWLDPIRSGTLDAPSLATTFITVASNLRRVEASQAQMAENRRQAQTMSGGSSKPGSQSDEDAYREHLYEIARRESSLLR
jgi:hypothetical protein